MKIDEILRDFVKECSKRLNLMSIVQFGSSTYLKNPKDIDLVFFFNNMVFSKKEFERLISITKNFEKKHPEISFNMSNTLHSKKYKITIVPLQNADLKYQIDKVFLRFIQKDSNKKILFGKDPLKDLTIHFEKNNLSDQKEYISYFFKSVLRIMLLDQTVSKKEELIEKFNKKYSKIELPKNYIKILNHYVDLDDYTGVLRFSKDCLEVLAK